MVTTSLFLKLPCTV